MSTSLDLGVTSTALTNDNMQVGALRASFTNRRTSRRQEHPFARNTRIRSRAAREPPLANRAALPLNIQVPTKTHCSLARERGTAKGERTKAYL